MSWYWLCIEQPQDGQAKNDLALLHRHGEQLIPPLRTLRRDQLNGVPRNSADSLICPWARSQSCVIYSCWLAIWITSSRRNGERLKPFGITPVGLPGACIGHLIANVMAYRPLLVLEVINTKSNLARFPASPLPRLLRPHLREQHQGCKEEYHVRDPRRQNRIDDPSGPDGLSDLNEKQEDHRCAETDRHAQCGARSR